MTDFEKYFFTKLRNDTDIEDCYFCMPSNDCFTYCISELKNALENQLEENIKNNYVLELSRWFFKFLENDRILKSIDSLKFSQLLLLLKEMSEGKSFDKKEIITTLQHLKNQLSYKYFQKIRDELLRLSLIENQDYVYVDSLIELFLNECLARDVDIRFIYKTIEWYKKKYFKSFDSFLNFFVDKIDISYDIYLPIKNYKTINKDVFKQNDQEIVSIESEYFLHIYENRSIDYYRIITSHMIRVDSIFNTLKLYTHSEIDYDFEKDILVDIKCLELSGITEVFFPFSQINKYKGANPYSKFMSNSINNLNKLYSMDKDLYHKILNIIGYSEKNNDSINSSSFVDSWIALESLYSLNETTSGFKAVKSLLPLFISSKIIINKLTHILRNAFIGKNIKAEEFIEMSFSDIEELSKKAKSLYYKREIIKAKNNVDTIKSLKRYYEAIEQRVSIDITRIYMLRNEYVHESKLSAFRSLQFYRLRNYLVLSIDLFFGMLNQIIDLENEYGNIGYSVFARLKEKNCLRQTFFTVSTEKRKYKNNTESLEISEIGNTVSLNDITKNIVFNNNSIVKKFVKYEK